MLPDNDIIEMIKEKISPVELHELEVDHDGESQSLLVHTPSRIEWMKFLHDLSATEDIGKKTSAHENFVLAVTEWPSRDEAKEFLSKKFGSLTEITDQLGKLVGAGAQVRAKKL
jgi:hypothetical protein